VRDTTISVGGGYEIAVWKVPRHRPLVLLIVWDLGLALQFDVVFLALRGLPWFEI
jgi:hypothetical protein